MTEVTVIIPVYNRAKTIKKTLCSLLMQSFKKFSVIIVDDCSDDSLELKKAINEFPTLNVRYFRHEMNLHGGAARNTGISNAEGKYVAFLDSDDHWHKDKLKMCLEQSINENDIIYSQIMDRGVVRPSIPFEVKVSIDDYLLVDNGTMQTSSLFMHRSFALEVMFDPSLKRFQDYDFIIRASKIFKANFVFIDKVLVEMGEADKGNRISSSTNHIPALYWLEKISPLLTKKSKAVFAFNRLINYATNNISRFEIVSLFFKFDCHLYIRNLNFKVLIKFILGNKQKWLRK